MGRSVSALVLVLLLSCAAFFFSVQSAEATYYYNFAIAVVPEFPSVNNEVSVTVSLETACINYVVNFSLLSKIGNNFSIAIDIHLPLVELPTIGYEEEKYLLGKLVTGSYVFKVTVQVWEGDDPLSFLLESHSYIKSFTVKAWNIAVPDDYPTIREAINAASIGDTIFVRSGTYYEGFLLVNRTLSLIGEGQGTTIIDGGYMFTPIVQITASNVTVKGFTIQNSGLIFGWEGGGIYITNSNWNTVAENTINNTQYGINLKNSKENTITDNNIIANGIGMLFLDSHSNNSIIYHNNLIENGWQVHHLSSPSSCVWDNGCEGNYWSNYNGLDLNGDGVGDTYLPWKGVDYYPLMKPYLWWNPADINYDFEVDIFDISLAAYAYDSTPSSDNWNPAADLAPPYGKINIYDCVTIAYHYGKTYP